MQADSQSSAQREPRLLFACASPYVTVNPLVRSHICVHTRTHVEKGKTKCCNLYNTTQTKKMSVQTSAFPQMFA